MRESHRTEGGFVRKDTLPRARFEPRPMGLKQTKQNSRPARSDAESTAAWPPKQTKQNEPCHEISQPHLSTTVVACPVSSPGSGAGQHAPSSDRGAPEPDFLSRSSHGQSERSRFQRHALPHQRGGNSALRLRGDVFGRRGNRPGADPARCERARPDREMDRARPRCADLDGRRQRIDAAARAP